MLTDSHYIYTFVVTAKIDIGNFFTYFKVCEWSAIGCNFET